MRHHEDNVYKDHAYRERVGVSPRNLMESDLPFVHVEQPEVATKPPKFTNIVTAMSYTPLPADYGQQVKAICERQAALSGYRLATLLKDLM